MATNYRTGEAQGYPVTFANTTPGPVGVPDWYVPSQGGTGSAQGGSSLTQTRHVRPQRSVHHVRPGENLADIAAMYGLTYQEIFSMNSHSIGRGVIHPGMRLQV